MLLLLLIAAADARDVLTGAPVEALLQEAPEPPPRAPVDWVSSEAVYTLEPVEGGLNVRARYRLTALEDGWVFAPLVDGALMVTSASPGVTTSDGRWWYLGEVEGEITVEVAGFLPTGGDQASLGVAPAARQSFVPVIGLDRALTVEGAVTGSLPPTETLDIQWGPKPAPRAITTVAQGRTATAVTVADDWLEVVSRVRWIVRRGELSALALRLPGEAQALEVTGPPASTWERSGDRVIVSPTEPIEGFSEVTLRWQVPLRKGAADLQLPEPLGVVSNESVSTLAGDGERLIAPQARGLRVMPLDALPDWARGLGAGTPLAAWTGDGALSVRALSVQPLDGPPLVVDAMRCQQAASEGGRSLLRCQLDVRNASQQFLTVDAPEGWRLWTARVNGDMVPPVTDGAASRVPLERSVETMEGLTTLDVDLVFQVEDSPWTRRGERALALPALDAPVARLEWTVRLPPGLRGRRVGGSAREPDEAAGEIVYGFTASSTQALWTDALRAYQENRFEESQGYLDLLAREQQDDPAAGNIASNAARLQSNLSVLIEDKEVSAAEEAQARRVKDLARAKVAVEEVTRQDKLAEVERQLQSGDVENALKELEKLEEENRQLSYVEQDEAASSSYVAEQLSSYKEEAKRQVSEKSNIATRSSSKNAEVSPSVGGGKSSGAKSDRASLSKKKSGLSSKAAPSADYDYDKDHEEGDGKDYDGIADEISVEKKPQMILNERELSDEDDGVAFGEDKAEDTSGDTIVYRQRTEIDFESVEVTGELVKPEGALILDRKSYNNPAAGRGGGGEGGDASSLDFATGGAPGAPTAGPLNQAPLPVPPRDSFEISLSDNLDALMEEDAEEEWEEEPYPEPEPAPIVAASPAPPPPPAKGEILNKEILDRIPTGRSYQSAVESVQSAQSVSGIATSRHAPPDSTDTDGQVVSDPIEGTTTINIGDVDRDTRTAEAVDDLLSDRRERWEREADRASRRAASQAAHEADQRAREADREFRQQRRRGAVESQLDFWRSQSEDRKRERYFAARETELAPDDWSPPRALAATTFAIPLPDHGESLLLSQRLLAPGEQAVVEIKYKQKRKEREK